MTLFKNKYRIESARLKGWDYSSPGLYFVTVCTKNRECFLGDVVNAETILSPIGEIVADEWSKTPTLRANVQLDEWVVMPNHLHGIIFITHAVETPPVETPHRGVSTGQPPSRLQPNSLGSILGQIKSVCTKRIRLAGCTDFDWQARFHDQIIRNERTLNAIRQYIRDNPANWEKDKDKPAGLRM